MKFWTFIKKHDILQIAIIIAGIGVFSYIGVRITGEHPCQAGCGIKVKPSGAHFTLCTYCKGEGVWNCVKHKPNGYGDPHRKQCDECGKWYYTCYNSSVPKSEQSSYKHRIVSKHEDGTPIRACKSEDSFTFSNPNQ